MHLQFIEKMHIVNLCANIIGYKTSCSILFTAFMYFLIAHGIHSHAWRILICELLWIITHPKNLGNGEINRHFS